MIQLVVVPLVLAVSYLTVRLVERSTPPADRIVARPSALRLADYRPPVDTPPAPLGDWATDPGPAVWSAGRVLGDLPATTWPNPPVARHMRQTKTRPDGNPLLTSSVAVAWDRWEQRPDRRNVYVVRGLPVCHHADTQQIAAVA